MKRNSYQAVWLLGMVGLLLAACASPAAHSGPSQFLNFSAVRDQYAFDTETTDWDTYVIEGSAALFQVADGALLGAVIPNRGYSWSLSRARHTNTAVAVTAQQTQGRDGNGFGILCRADTGGNGYYFVISSDGQFAILKGTARQADPLPLVAWQPSDAIHTGTATNDLLAVCAANYLSFTVNGQFLAEAYDDEFAAGKLGMVLGAVGETAWVRFDDITIRDANLVAGR